MSKTELERNDNAGIKTQNHKSAEGQDDPIMSLVIKRLCALLIYNQQVEHTCMN